MSDHLHPAPYRAELNVRIDTWVTEQLAASPEWGPDMREAIGEILGVQFHLPVDSGTSKHAVVGDENGHYPLPLDAPDA
ncbi:hypothetical protein ACWHBW_15730 [Streptomyces albidoflavus]